MSLAGRNFQTMSVFKVKAVATRGDGTPYTFFSDALAKSDLDVKTDAIEVWSGIANQRKFYMHTKKDMKFNVTINEFDLNFLAFKNGVELDKTNKGTIYVDQQNSVTTGTCIIGSASRIIGVKDSTDNDLDIITTGIPTAGQVLVEYTSSGAGTSQVEKLTVTTAPTSAGNVTVTFNDGTTTTKTVALLSTDTVSTTANKIATAFSSLTGWTVTSATGSADVVFTASAPAANKLVAISLTDTDSTGTGSLTGTHVTNGTAPSVSGATLTFNSSYTDPYVLVTYAGDQVAGKDNWTISLSAGAFPPSVELICSTIVIDQAINKVVGDAILHFYSAIGDPDGTLSFDLGKPIEIPVTFAIMSPTYLPDGTRNLQGSMGELIITERPVYGTTVVSTT